MRAVAIIGLSLTLLSGCAQTAQVGPQVTELRLNGAAFRASVVPWKVLRERKLVRQGWDTSCGAAALSTVLTHHYGARVNEASIAISILHNTDPDLVRSRGGFSLLDLKRFVEAIGFRGAGYTGLTIDDLEEFAVPMILPVRLRDFDHFVVYRGRVGDRVLVGDPAFGNLVMTDSQLEAIWHGRVGFVVLPGSGVVSDRRPMFPDELDLVVPNLRHVGRRLRGMGPVPPTSRDIVLRP